MRTVSRTFKVVFSIAMLAALSAGIFAPARRVSASVPVVVADCDEFGCWGTGPEDPICQDEQCQPSRS